MVSKYNVVEFISIINARVGASLLCLPKSTMQRAMYTRKCFSYYGNTDFNIASATTDCKDCRIIMIFTFHSSLHVKYPEIV